MEFALTGFVPYGSWGSAAYTQRESLVLLQMASVTGLYGVSFIIAWTASVGNWLLDADSRRGDVRRGAVVFAATLTAVLIFGGARLVLTPPAAETVRVAGLTSPEIDLFPNPEVAQDAVAGEVTDSDIEEIRRRGNLINDDLLWRAEREAVAGAQIVFFGEANAFAFKEDEPALIARGVEVARTHGVFLGLAVATWNTGAPKPLENKLLLIDPRGEVRWEFWKGIPVPGGESAISALDDGLIDVTETPYGRIGGAICFDMDFPNLLKQAGNQGADIMLVPSNDWREIDPWHSHMARLRAVEQGFNMIRHVSNGLSLATDYQGRVLGSMDHYTTTDRALIAHVPIAGTRTIYSRIGDTFAWLCVIGLLAATVASLRRRGRADGAVAPATN
jgi:apolipoprotein N-acyltransferase